MLLIYRRWMLPECRSTLTTLLLAGNGSVWSGFLPVCVHPAQGAPTDPGTWVARGTGNRHKKYYTEFTVYHSAVYQSPSLPRQYSGQYTTQFTGQVFRRHTYAVCWYHVRSPSRETVHMPRSISDLETSLHLTLDQDLMLGNTPATHSPSLVLVSLLVLETMVVNTLVVLNISQGSRAGQFSGTRQFTVCEAIHKIFPKAIFWCSRVGTTHSLVIMLERYTPRITWSTSVQFGFNSSATFSGSHHLYRVHSRKSRKSRKSRISEPRFRGPLSTLGVFLGGPPVEVSVRW